MPVVWNIMLNVVHWLGWWSKEWFPLMSTVALRVHWKDRRYIIKVVFEKKTRCLSVSKSEMHPPAVVPAHPFLFPYSWIIDSYSLSLYSNEIYIGSKYCTSIELHLRVSSGFWWSEHPPSKCEIRAQLSSGGAEGRGCPSSCPPQCSEDQREGEGTAPQLPPRAPLLMAIFLSLFNASGECFRGASCSCAGRWDSTFVVSFRWAIWQSQTTHFQLTPTSAFYFASGVGF